MKLIMIVLLSFSPILIYACTSDFNSDFNSTQSSYEQGVANCHEAYENNMSNMLCQSEQYVQYNALLAQADESFTRCFCNRDFPCC